jgi:hypothetical protein
VEDKQMKRELIFCMVAISLVFSACSQEADVYPIILPALTQTPIPSVTATATQPPPTPTYTIDPSVPTPTFTLTPYPRLDEEASMQLAEELYTYNTGCDRLPCWWGAIPGESDWEGVKNYLSSFAFRIPEGIGTEEWSFYEVSIQVPSRIYGDYFDGYKRVVYFIENGVVEAIEIFYPIVHSFTLQTILAKYGPPSEVVVSTSLPVPHIDPVTQFSLNLFYGEQGLLVHYFVNAEEVEGGMRGCFENEKPGLIVGWNPLKGWSYEDIVEMMVGISLPYNYVISEVTDYTPEGFYRAFNGISGWKCIFIDESFLVYLE